MSRTLFIIELAILAAAAEFFGLEQAPCALVAGWVTQRALNFVEIGIEASQSVFTTTAHLSPI